MTQIANRIVVLLFAMLAALPGQAQPAPRSYSQAELDQMLAPIALYPDPLLSQVLMAATYPLEVVQAARWSRANPGLQGDTAVRAVQVHDWDPSVKSLVAFPQILQRMDENLPWTESLGDAFLAQEPLVMDTVQQLRRRAQAAGNLQSDAQVRVEQQGPVIVVQPAAPEVVYLPYYDPYVVYGPWWWPAYRPVAWAPWPGYARAPGVSAGFWFGSPSGVSLGFFFGSIDWGHRNVRVVHPGAYYYRPPVVVVNHTTVVNRNVTVDRGAWQHDPRHRRGAEARATVAPTRVQDLPQVSQARQMQLRTQQPQAVPQVSPARQMQLRTQQPQPMPQASQARQMQLRSEQAQARPQAQPPRAPVPAPVARQNMRYHAPSSERQGAQAWQKSRSSPVREAESARPPRSRS